MAWRRISGLQGLGEVIEGPQLHGVHRVLVSGKTGEHDHQGLGVVESQVLH